MKTCTLLATALLHLSLATALAQDAASPPSAQSPTAPASQDAGTKTFSQQELEQLLAPIALHPDALLAQILMASTYPLEVVAAERWVKANPGLKEKALEDALQAQPWDPSVKSLAVFPEVLTMMSEKIDWTQKLGDAFLGQQKDVMAAVQMLRGKAQAQGTLKDSPEQKVVTEKAETTTVIKIEPTNPEVVYVPTYNPTVVYGPWSYPSYPPYSYYPPGYAAGTALFSFAAGAIVGGALWGDCDWGRGDVNVNVNRYNNFNRSNVSNRNWSHNASHRGAVPYRNQAVAQRYGRTQPANAGSREQFRGRAEAGQREIQREGREAGAARSATTSTTTARADASRGQGTGRERDSGRPQGTNRERDASRAQSASRERDAGTRTSRGDTVSTSSSRGSGSLDSRGTRSASALDTRQSAQTRDYSNRGSTSLNSARSSGNFSGGVQSSGGGARGGGAGAAGGGGGRGGGGRR